MTQTSPRLSNLQTYLKQIVYGGNDGIVTTFAIVAGFQGAQADGAAQLGALAVLVFGLANLFADGVSMGLGEYLSLRAQGDLFRRRRAETLRGLQHGTPAARDRLGQAFAAKGLSPSDAQSASAILARNPQLMAEMLMTYGEGIEPPAGTRPAANGLSTFAAFIAFGVIPLVPYFLSTPTTGTFRMSVAATLAALVLLGLLRRNATGDSLARAVGETVLVGVVCALVAYAVGALVGG